jgi:hypothetical protein
MCSKKLFSLKLTIWKKFTRAIIAHQIFFIQNLDEHYNLETFQKVQSEHYRKILVHHPNSLTSKIVWFFKNE